MLQVANTLTAEDLDLLRESAPSKQRCDNIVARESVTATKTVDHGPDPLACEGPEVMSGSSRGAYERSRTRQSKISTSCVGNERAKHEWWPVGTELVGDIGSEVFTSTVVENDRVKSGRSILITSGAANGQVCLTPTRAALEATEAYRQSKNLGRAGGVTNGWTFWKTRTTE